MTRLFAGSIRTYLQAENDSGHSVSFHQTGGLRLAATMRELELFHLYKKRYGELDIPFYIRSPAETKQLNPLIDTSCIFGAAHTSTDGHVDPTGATNALAKAARILGAQVERFRPVDALYQNKDHWVLETEKGNISAQHLVIAASFWARELLAPLGLNLPLYATQHHELITEDIPQIKEMDRNLPAMRDSYVSCSVRQEANGLLAGIYESEPEFWSLEGIPKDFKEELLPPDIDRLASHLERLCERMPAFAEAGIKLVNNGPMCWTPDGLPMLDPMHNQNGLWMASGFNVGIGTGGGAGEFLAHWMNKGQPLFDLSSVHADRFGNDMTTEYALNSIRKVYARGYQLPASI
jgi:glycine/D-amino acid oxidase-like deaminating enzyme